MLTKAEPFAYGHAVPMSLLFDMRLRLGVGVLILGLAVVVAVLVFSVFNGNDGGDDPTATGTPIDPELQALLESMVLSSEDLPAGLQRVGLLFSTNEDIVESAPDPEAELAELERLGRRLGIDANFAPTGAVPEDFPVRGGIQNTVSLYTAPEGASESFQEGVDGARQTDWPSLYPDLRTVVADEVDRRLGDQSVWFRITGVDDSGQFIVDDQVAFRVGPARSFLRVVTAFDEGAGGDVYLNEVEGWARLVVDRIERELGLSARGESEG